MSLKVLKEIEGSLSESNVEIRKQVQLLQGIITKKDDKVRDLTQSLIQAVTEIGRERRKKENKSSNGARNAFMCTML